jgi:hypothetical protein
VIYSAVQRSKTIIIFFCHGHVDQQYDDSAPVSKGNFSEYIVVLMEAVMHDA